jgi:hypothetical protein
MKDWKKIAAGQDLAIPKMALERISPALDALEAAFRPLAAIIPENIEPAVTFHIPEEKA